MIRSNYNGIWKSSYDNKQACRLKVIPEMRTKFDIYVFIIPETGHAH
jgi:hypothetical protein